MLSLFLAAQITSCLGFAGSTTDSLLSIDPVAQKFTEIQKSFGTNSNTLSPQVIRHFGKSVAFTGFDKNDFATEVFTANSRVGGVKKTGVRSILASEGGGLFGPVGGQFLFPGRSKAGSGLYGTDGTVEGTKPVRLFKPGFESFGSQDSGFRYNPVIAGNNLAVVKVSDEKEGDSLWVTDGTEAGTSFIRQESSYAEDAFDDASTVSSYDPFLEGGPLGRDKLIFLSSSYDEGTEEIRTSWTVVSKDGGYKVDEFLNPSTLERGHYLGAVGNVAVLLFKDPFLSPGEKVEIWSTDGTPDGSALLGKSSSENFVTVGRLGGRLYFENGKKLWTTDGTEKGTFAFAKEASSWQVMDFRGSPLVLSVSAGAFQLHRINFKSKTLLTIADVKRGPFAAVRLVEAPTYGAKKYFLVVLNSLSSVERRARVITYSGRTIRSIARSGDRTLENGPEQTVAFRRNARCDVK